MIEHFSLKSLAVLRNTIDLTTQIPKVDFAADTQIANLSPKSRAGKICLMLHCLH